MDEAPSAPPPPSHGRRSPPAPSRRHSEGPRHEGFPHSNAIAHNTHSGRSAAARLLADVLAAFPASVSAHSPHPPLPTSPPHTHTHPALHRLALWCSPLCLRCGKTLSCLKRNVCIGSKCTTLRGKRHISVGNARPQPHWPTRHSTT